MLLSSTVPYPHLYSSLLTLSIAFGDQSCAKRASRLPKMIASRSFNFPARQCLRIANALRPWVPTIAPIAQVCEVSIACTASEDNAYKSACSNNQLRSYSIPYEDKIAKFKGKKGSDVCDTLILQGPTYVVCWTRSLKEYHAQLSVSLGQLHSHTNRRRRHRPRDITICQGYLLRS